MKKRIAFGVLVVVVAAGAYIKYFSVAAVLARHGVFFDDDATAFSSPSLKEVEFWFDNGRSRLPGPSVVGDLLYVDWPSRSADGHLEFVVRSEVHAPGGVRIQLLEPPKGDIAFHVVDRHFNVHYPQEGIFGAP